MTAQILRKRAINVVLQTEVVEDETDYCKLFIIAKYKISWSQNPNKQVLNALSPELKGSTNGDSLDWAFKSEPLIILIL